MTVSMQHIVETKSAIYDESASLKSESSDDQSAEENTGCSNAAWADSIAKILKTSKPKGKKALVLSKAKKLTDLKLDKSKPAGYDIATIDGKIKEKVRLELSDGKESAKKKKKKDTFTYLRRKPNILEKDRERTLQKIATKGVVQLFNAVQMQQKDIHKKLANAGPLEVRKEKVLKNIDKRAFLDVLMGEKSENVNDIVRKKQNKEKKEKESTWNVLRDDFMMSAKMKDWDKQLEDRELEENDIEFE